MKKKILITCANGVTSYKLISKLSSKYIVYGIDMNIIGIGKSRCHYFYKSPNPDSKEYIPFLKKLLNKVDIAFLYSDEEILSVLKAKKNNKIDDTKLVLSDSNTLEICLDKMKLNKFLKRKQTKFLKIPELNHGSKCVIKPTYGRGSKNILFTENKKIRNFFSHLKESFIVQKFIEGKEYTVDCYFDKSGILKDHLMRERVIKSSVSISSKIIKNDDVKKPLIYLSKLFKFYGPINIQFIKKKNIFYLIEINPRLSGSLSFSIEAGFDPFRLSIEEYLDLKIKPFKKTNSIYFHRYYDFIQKKKIN
jgi:carbamoyl-phosphate synthase large subunit